MILSFHFSFPQPMEVAIFASRYLLGIGQEGGFWLLAWVEFVAEHIGWGEQLYPLNIMLRQHRMLYASHLYTIAAIDRFYHRHMLLLGTIRCILLHQFHGLSATAEYGSGIHYFHYVATNCATVNFSVLSHNCSS